MQTRVRLLAVTLAAALLAVACDESGPSAVAPAARSVTSGGSAGALNATTHAASVGGLLSAVLPAGSDSVSIYECSADSVAHTSSAMIGIAGGTIAFGPHSLFIPPGSLLKPTTITATAAGDGHVSAVFQPEGLKFLVPAVLTMSYRQCATPPVGTVSIVYLQGLLGEILDILPAKLDAASGTVVAPVSHFSVYAVADRHQ